MDNVFVDTDVVLDLFIRREPHHTEALQLFTYIKRSKAKCFTFPNRDCKRILHSCQGQG